MELALAGSLWRETLRWLGWLAAGGFLFVLPGWGLLDCLHPEWPQLSPGEKAGLAAGMSLAIYPLLMLWTDLVGLHAGAVYVFTPAVLATLWLVYSRLKHRRRFRLHWRWPSAPEVLALAAGMLIVATRILVVRDLTIPLWGDSYQHTVITQLIIDRGGLFADWAPYAELQSFTYHFGFHSAAAVFHWVTAVSTPRTVLVTGQIINLLAVLALYPLAARAYKSGWSGPAALVIGGLLLWTPMIYTQWGRYTQLTGQAILPAAVCLAWARLEVPAGRWKDWIPAGLALSGLALTHYRVAIFAAFFLAALLLLRPNRKRFWQAAILGLGAGLLALPWAPRLYGGGIWANFNRQITTLPEQMGEFARSYNAFGGLETFLPGWAWPAAVLAVVLALWRRQIGVLLVAAWWALLLLGTNPDWFGLPGSGVISNFAYWIAAYIPASILIGAGLAMLIDTLAARIERGKAQQAGNSRRMAAGWALALLLLALWGASRRPGDLDLAAYSLVARADVLAARWIKANTPPQARFLVNSFPAYGGSVVAGSDAGWWLPLLAGRQTSQPPLNYGTERGPWPGYVAWVNALPKTIAAKGIGHPEVTAMLQERRLDYVYIGAKQNPPEARLPVEAMLEDAHFKPVYFEEGVWIFEFHPAP